MAARKLQTEIDRCLKKVAEGVEVFEELYEKLYASTNPAQKEKCEGDLKKEIKKLQRLRDQIKSWQSSSEIKDKKQLIDTRKLIETQMEKFKACEREMKTKQFSKEGLNAKEKLDPAEVDALEAESELINAAKGKRGVKVDTDRLSEIEGYLERHKFHKVKLEAVLRNLENDNISTEDVETIKENVEYYIDSNQEPDFYEDEEMYDHLNLVDDDHVGLLDDHQHSLQPTSADSLADKSASGSKDEDMNGSAESLKDGVAVSAAADQGKKKAGKEEAADKKKAGATAKQGKVTPAPAAPAAPARIVPPAFPAAKSLAQPTIKYAAVASAGTPVQEKTTTQVKPPRLPAFVDDTASATSTVPATVPQKEVSFSSIVQHSATGNSAVSDVLSSEVTPASLSPVGSKPDEATAQKEESTKNQDWWSRFPPSFNDLISTYNANRKRTYGVGDDMLRNQYLIHLLNSSFQNCPDVTDTERPEPYEKPANTANNVPSYYPQENLVNLTSPAMFERFDIDTLFFIFYYQQGTIYQYLAARELKRQSWRFHKKYMTWFQRHEEPRAITDEYEQGTYVYFDFEGTWCQRKKSEFTFEYRFLEGE